MYDTYPCLAYSQLSIVTYIQDYLNEYCYRYNRHRMKGEILDDIITRMVRHEPCTAKTLKA